MQERNAGTMSTVLRLPKQNVAELVENTEIKRRLIGLSWVQFRHKSFEAKHLAKHGPLYNLRPPRLNIEDIFKKDLQIRELSTSYAACKATQTDEAEERSDGSPSEVVNKILDNAAAQSRKRSESRSINGSPSEVNVNKVLNNAAAQSQKRSAEMESQTNECNRSISERDLKRMFPRPKSILHNAMDMVATDLKSREYTLHPVYKQVLEKKSSSWCCTYNLKWPEVIKFSAQAKNKQEASHKAAIAALTWLHKTGRINAAGQPVIFDMKETTKKSRQQLSFDKETISGMLDIVDSHRGQFVLKIAEKLPSEEDENEDDAPPLSEPTDVRFKRRMKFFGEKVYMAKEKVKLPITEYKKQFIDLLENNRVVIVKGEPGCGKSTRIPQYVLESWIQSAEYPTKTPCRIAVTQPRRIAAISLASRVATERDESVGDIVGYQVRLKSSFKPHTGRILYCTTGILLRHLQSDQNLTNFTHVILDEAHERDVDTDLLMNLLRSAMKTNPDLKVVVMSATIDTDMFQRYFDGAPILNVPGFTYPVKTHFLDEVTRLDLSDTVRMCESDMPSVVHSDVVEVIELIHRTRPEGAILCFLPGWEDISKIQKALPSTKDMSVMCLHSRLQDSDQWKIFSRPPPGIRKVILATNIAETSVTIDDVVYVVDAGIHKENRFDNEKGINCIDNHWISKSSMIQRKGRAGRVQPGESFHLYPRSKYDRFDDFCLPEILRTSLTKIVLNSKVYSNNMNALEFMSQLPCPPEDSATRRAVHELKELELLDDTTENLTALGRVLANFQLEPKLAKVLVNSVVYKCTSPVVDIVTLYSADSEIFSSSLNHKEVIKRIKSNHCQNSDHLALMRIFEKYLELTDYDDVSGIDRLCTNCHLVQHKLEMLAKIRQIHFEYLYNGLKDVFSIADDFSDNEELVKAVLLSGVGTILQQRNWDIVKGRLKKTNVFISSNNYRSMLTSDSVNFHKTEFPSNLFVYINETRSNIRRINVVRECSVISPLAVLLFSNKKIMMKESDENENQVIVGLKGTKVQFICDKKDAEVVTKCKEVLNEGYQYFIYQITEGNEKNEAAISCWNEILVRLNKILLRNSV